MKSLGTRGIACSRTKWKRQNQLRLEQLRQQTNIDDLLARSGECCGPLHGPPPPAAHGHGPPSFLPPSLFRTVGYVHGPLFS